MPRPKIVEGGTGFFPPDMPVPPGVITKNGSGSIKPVQQFQSHKYMYFDEAFIQAVIQVMDMWLFSSYNNTKLSERFIELCYTLYSEYTDGYNRIIYVSNCSYNLD